MKIISEKLDYELYKALFDEKDYNKSYELWQIISKNPAILNEALHLDGVKGNPIMSFVSPTICMMILKFPNSVPDEIYNKVSRTVIENGNLANSIMAENTIVDMLSLIMQNKGLQLSKYQKDLIKERLYQNRGIQEDKKIVVYGLLLDIDSPQVAYYESNGLKVSVSEYEGQSFDKHEVKSYGDIKQIRSLRDFRLALLNNENFTDNEREAIANDIAVDELLFQRLIKDSLFEIFKNNNSLLDTISLEDIRDKSLAEILELVGNDKNLADDITLLKKVVDSHYKKVISLARIKE